MSTSHEYDFCLFYKPLGDSAFLIISAPSIEELKVEARKDSLENVRDPSKYTYEYTTSGMLFNNEEIRQVRTYNVLRELDKGDE
jgi:hypothetical protein